MNAAEYLLAYFETDSAGDAKHKGFRFPNVVDALEEVESVIKARREAGFEVDLEMECLTRWKESALEPFVQGSGIAWEISWGSLKTGSKLNAGDLMGLRVVADRMKESSLQFTGDQRSKIVELLSESRKALGDIAASLPEGLALYLSRLMREVETALDEYAITGDFVLERAFCRLREGLDVAMLRTPDGDSGKWDNAKAVLRELAIGFMIEAPSLAIDAAQLFPQIGS